MSINLKDLVKEEPPKCYEESFYHLSGLHICKEFSKNVYYVIPNNEFKNLNDIDIYKKNRQKHNSFESALKETSEIVQFANTRGAQDARFIQKRRGSDYKVNSSDDSEKEEISRLRIKKKESFSLLSIENKAVRELNILRKSNAISKLLPKDKLPYDENLVNGEFFESSEVFPINLEKDFKDVLEIDSYELGTAAYGVNGIDSTSRMPLHWELYGKCLDNPWLILDTQKDVQEWEPNEIRLYKLDSSPVKVSKIRLVIKNTQDGNVVRISSLKVHNSQILLNETKEEEIIPISNRKDKFTRIFSKDILYKIYEKLKNSSKLKPLKQKLSPNQKIFIRRSASLLLKLTSKEIYFEIIKKIKLKNKKTLKNGLISYGENGFENYFLAKDIEKDETFNSNNINSQSYVFLANDSAATNELTAELKSHNIIKLHQKLYCVVKHGVPVLPDELESGRHIKNENIGTFTNERDAVDWIYSNLNNEEVGISIDKAPELVDTLINKKDIGIENYLYFFQSIYILIPSFYGIKERSLGNELSDLKVFKEKYSQVAIADDKDFLKEIFNTRETMPNNHTYQNAEFTLYKDKHCMLLKDNLSELNYDLLNIDSIKNLDENKRAEIRNFILKFDEEQFKDVKDTNKNVQKYTTINQIGEMYIVENEGYYIAIRSKYLENFPENDYLNDPETRYDVSISVIEDYCKDLL